MSTFPTFLKDGARHRLVRRICFERERGYAESSEEHYNVLQAEMAYRFMPFFKHWVDIETEHIPSCAWISQATLGWADWESKLVTQYRSYLPQPSAGRK